MSTGPQDGREPIETALEWFARLADLPAPERERRLRSIEDPALRACVDELLRGDRATDERLARGLRRVADLHGRAVPPAVDYPVERFVIDRVRREARARGLRWSPSPTLATTLASRLHDPEIAADEKRALSDSSGPGDPFARLLGLRIESALSIASSAAADDVGLTDVEPTSIRVVRDDGGTTGTVTSSLVDEVRRHVESAAAGRLCVLADAATFAELESGLCTRRVDRPEALSFHAAPALASGRVLASPIARVEVLELGASCQALEDRILGLAGVPRGEGAAASVDPWTGRLLHDKYRILDVIGTGGFGTVYEARDERGAGNVVAIKILRPHVAARPHLLQAFKSEARRATRLNHPNVVEWKVFDETDEGVQYFVMERLVGRELADLLADEGRLAPERAARILLGVTEALCAAHHLGPNESILHLDLKPSNVFVLPPQVGQEERVKVLDFGIGQYVGGDEEELEDDADRAVRDTTSRSDASARTSLRFAQLDELPTPTDASGRPFRRSTACTPEYASPEQCEHVLGRADIVPLDGRSDLFSLGVVAFRMLTGRLPFEPGVVRADVLRAHADEPAMTIAATGVAVPKRLARFVDRCLEHDRARRFGDAHEALEELRAIVERPSLAARIAGVAVALALLFAVGLLSRLGSDPPRVALSHEGQVLHERSLFLGPRRSSVRLRLVTPPADEPPTGRLTVARSDAEGPTFTASWHGRDAIELAVLEPPVGTSAHTLRIVDASATMTFEPLELVWIADDAWSLEQLVVDEHDRTARVTGDVAYLSADCRHLAVRFAEPDSPAGAGGPDEWIEAVELRFDDASESLRADPEQPRVYATELPTLAPGRVGRLVVRDVADARTELLELVVVPPLAVDLTLRDGANEDAPAFGAPTVLFPGTRPTLHVELSRPGTASRLPPLSDEGSWRLRDQDASPSESTEKRELQLRDGRALVDLGPIVESLASADGALDVTIVDDAVIHPGAGHASVTASLRFRWDASPAPPAPTWNGAPLRAGDTHFVRTRESVLALASEAGCAWRGQWTLADRTETFALAPEAQRASTWELALADEGEVRLRVRSRRCSGDVVSADVLEREFTLHVDSVAPRVELAALDDALVVRGPEPTRLVPLTLVDPGPRPSPLSVAYELTGPDDPDTPLASLDWTRCEAGRLDLDVPAPWLATGRDGRWELTVRARDDAGNEDARSIPVHVARNPPGIAFESPVDDPAPWHPADRDGWIVTVRAHDPNGVAAVDVRLDGRLVAEAAPYRLEERASLLERGGAWSGRLRLGHEWSGATVTLRVTATDAFGARSATPLELERRLPAIAAPVAIEARAASVATEPMRLVRGNADGAYLFMGRGRDVEYAAFERALAPLHAVRRAGRRDPFWRVRYEPGAIEDFYLDAREVGCGQFLSFVRDSDGYPEGRHWPTGVAPAEGRRQEWIERLAHVDPELPVTGVTWDEAHAYAHWADKRLPSLVEWEYAARGGRGYRAFAAEGSVRAQGESELAERLNVGLDRAVRSLRVRGSGDDVTSDSRLLDLTGNAREWTSTPCPPPEVAPRDHATSAPALQLRPESDPDWARRDDYWCAGGACDARRIAFHAVRRAPRDTRDPALGFRCALSVSAYRAARLHGAGPVHFEPSER